MPKTRAAALLGAPALAALALGACKHGAVRVDFRPSANSTYTYDIDVQATTTTAIQGRAPSSTNTDEHLAAKHVVQSRDGGGVTVDVRVTGAGVPPRTF